MRLCEVFLLGFEGFHGWCFFFVWVAFGKGAGFAGLARFVLGCRLGYEMDGKAPGWALL